jgi:hypothetical protein
MEIIKNEKNHLKKTFTFFAHNKKKYCIIRKENMVFCRSIFCENKE